MSINKYIFLILFLGFYFTVFPQQVIKQESKCQNDYIIVLRLNKIGKEYYFCNKTWKSKIVYLGKINVDKINTYKILSVFLISRQQNKRGRSEILLYDTTNKNIGMYLMDGPELLPNYIKNNGFILKENFREYPIIPNFDKEIPKFLFIKRDTIVDMDEDNAIGHFSPTQISR